MAELEATAFPRGRSLRVDHVNATLDVYAKTVAFTFNLTDGSQCTVQLTANGNNVEPDWGDLWDVSSQYHILIEKVPIEQMAAVDTETV